MRTAITVGITGDGKTTVISGVDVPYGIQRATMLGQVSFPRGIVRLELYSNPEKFRVPDAIWKEKLAQAQAKAAAKRPKPMIDAPTISGPVPVDPQVAHPGKFIDDGPPYQLKENREEQIAARKKTRGLAALVALAIGIMSLILASPVARAQSDPRYGTLTVGTTTWKATNCILATMTSNINYTIDCRKFQNVGVSVSYKHIGTGTDTAVLTFNKSLDGSTWNTSANGNLTMTVIGTGATDCCAVTNLNCAGIGFLRLATMLNNSATETITNIVIKVTQKLSAP